MSCYSTDSQEHRVNIGEERDPTICDYDRISTKEYLEDIMLMSGEDMVAWDRFLDECEDEDKSEIHNELLAGE